MYARGYVTRLRGVRAILRSRGRLSRRRFRIFESFFHGNSQFSLSSTLAILTHFRSDIARPQQTGAKVRTPPGHGACVILGLFLVQMKRCVHFTASHSRSSCMQKYDRFSPRGRLEWVKAVSVRVVMMTQRPPPRRNNVRVPARRRGLWLKAVTSALLVEC